MPLPFWRCCWLRSEALPRNFINFGWTGDTVDFAAALVSQTARTFRVALECQVMLVDILPRNKSLMDKLATAKEEMKKIKAEA